MTAAIAPFLPRSDSTQLGPWDTRGTRCHVNPVCVGMGVEVTASAGGGGGRREHLSGTVMHVEETCCRLTPVSSWVCPPPRVPSLLQQRQGLGPQPPHGRLFLGTGSSTRWSPGPYSHPGGEDDPARPWVGTRSYGLLGSLCFVCKGVIAVSSGRGIPAVSQPQR